MVERVCSQCDLGTSGIVLAVGIKETQENQFHVVIVLKTKGQLNAFHLAWNRVLMFDQLKPGYLIAIPEIDRRRLLSIAAKVRMAVNANKGGSVPYGFGSPENRFSSITFAYNNSSKEFGLTCATFVYSILCSAGWQILDYSDWEERDGDGEWRAKILEHLKNGIPAAGIGPASKEDYAEAEGCSPAIRIRPTDLVAAVGANEDQSPASFQQVVDCTDAVLQLAKVCGG